MRLRIYLLAFVAVFAASTTQAAQKPNFVFFLVDDLGWGDLGCYGATFHETPNLDQLCSEGMKFTNAYSACTVCSPSRAAIITGQYPGRLHLTDWIAGHGKGNPKLLIPDWKMKIDHSLITLPEALKEAGYKTQFFGKWHLMPNREPDLFDKHYPDSHGFDQNIGGREWGQPKGPGKYFHPFDMPNIEGSKEGDFLTDNLTDYAEKFIEDSKDEPFLLYLSYYAVHGPIMTKPEYLEKYKNKAKGFENKNNERVSPAYAGLLQSVDDSVGRVMKKLRELNLDKNTVVIFTGDNGGTSEQSSGGLRGAKALAYEGGTREPTFVKWPGVVQPGSICDTPIIGTDFYPTMLDMAGLAQKPDQHLDGVNLTSLLKQSGNIDRNELFWHYPHYHRTNPYGAIRQGNWKLIEFFEDGKLELYNLKKDPAEKNDLADTEIQLAKSMLEDLKAWRKSVDAQMPTVNPNYDAAKSKPAKPKSRPKQSSKSATIPVKTKLGMVSASSNQQGNPPQAAVDGKHTTRWAGNGDAVPQWWQVEFEEPQNLAGLTIDWKNPTWFNHKVEVSTDGKSWQTVVDQLESKQVTKKSEHKFQATAKFLRITVTNLGFGWVSMTEIRPILK
ncbi:MAG: sulfatase [Blastopirellula sp.]|nr:MAG: sulfatase [Blastopirellula sp.]